jgi:hypothetical protein
MQKRKSLHLFGSGFAGGMSDAAFGASAELHDIWVGYEPAPKQSRS